MANKFDSNLIAIESGAIYGRLYRNKKMKLPLTLFWGIRIMLQDFTLGKYELSEVVIELHDFTHSFKSFLPIESNKWVSFYHKFKKSFQNDILENHNTLKKSDKKIKSWKELPNKTFSCSDNIGSLHFGINNQTNNEYSQVKKFFYMCENGVEVQEIKLGSFNKNILPVSIKMKIAFDKFEDDPLSLKDDFYSDIFTIEANLELMATTFLNNDIKMKNAEAALKIAKNAIDLDDYTIKVNKEKPLFYVCAAGLENQDEYIFEPKI